MTPSGGRDSACSVDSGQTQAIGTCVSLEWDVTLVLGKLGGEAGRRSNRKYWVIEESHDTVQISYFFLAIPVSAQLRAGGIDLIFGQPGGTIGDPLGAVPAPPE